MNTLIYYSFNVMILAVIILIVGMIKPKWILLWMDKPGRLPIMAIAGAIFMAGAVMFGEGNKQKQQEQAAAAAAKPAQKPGSEVPDLH
jgi:undecaprenyl pyrophosphate phosphatase UppP